MPTRFDVKKNERDDTYMYNGKEWRMVAAGFDGHLLDLARADDYATIFKIMLLRLDGPAAAPESASEP